jgi:hypothetical protein
MITVASSPYRNEPWFAIVRTEIPPDLANFRVHYPRHGEPLTMDEETAMVAHFTAGKDFIQAEKDFGREEFSIQSSNRVWAVIRAAFARNMNT